MPGGFGIWWVDWLIIVAAVLAAGSVVWRRALKPIVDGARAFVDYVHKVDEVHAQVIPDPADPYSHLKLVERVQMVGQTAEAATGEAHAAHTEATKANETATRCVQRIDDHSDDDQANFQAIADWSRNFRDFKPIRLPARRRP